MRRRGSQKYSVFVQCRQQRKDRPRSVTESRPAADHQPSGAFFHALVPSCRT